MPYSDSARRLNDPVEYLATDRKEPEQGTALCLSGGGYRAMIFHVGVIWRLYESGWLKKLDRVSSVSGGSITAAVLGLAWERLKVDAPTNQSAFMEHFVQPICNLAGETIDAWGIVGGIMLPGTISQKIQNSFSKHLFGNATLQDLVDKPRFVINAINVQSGVLWRFSKPYMRDYRVGEIKKPRITLSEAVAASSAFPPVLSPMVMELNSSMFTPNSGDDLQREPFTSRVVLSDGGVYDNLGLETAWKRYDTILVSDAGGQLQPEEEPKEDWARHSYRILNLIDNQVRCLRKLQVIQSYCDQRRKGAYWGTRTDIADYQLPDALPCPHNRTLELAATPTRFKRMGSDLQKRLINWGYAVCDAALRKHVDTSLERGKFPYPDAGI